MPVLLDNRPPVPLRSLRFARFLSTGGDNPAPYRVLAVSSAFPPRGARPTTAFRGFMAARASNERAFAFGVSSDRSEGRKRHGPLADSYVCRRVFPSRVRPWCRKSAKNRYDARIISSSSFLTKPSYGAFPRGVLVGLIPKSGRESTEKSSNYDTTWS